MSQYTKRFARLALVAALFGATAAAQAQTEIQWWHSMTGALNDRVNEFAKGFNESQKDYKVVAGLQGPVSRVDGRRDRGVPRGQRAAHPSGVRGRHGDDDGGEGRDQAGPGGDARGRREVRSRSPTSAPSPATTRPARARCCRSRSTARRRSSTTTRTCSRRPASTRTARPRPGPKSWPRRRRSRRRARRNVAYTTGWPSWVHVENFSAWHNVPIGTKENGMAGLDTTFQINSPLHVRHWTNLKEWAGKGYFTYAGRRNERGVEVLQRRVRDADVVVGRAGEHQPQREVQVRASRCCRTTPT